MTIKVEYLRHEQLEVGAEYYVLARNFEIATWNGKEFVGKRRKFNTVFEDTEQHWDEGPPHGTVKPLAKLNDEFEELNLNDRENNECFRLLWSKCDIDNIIIADFDGVRYTIEDSGRVFYLHKIFNELCN